MPKKPTRKIQPVTKKPTKAVSTPIRNSAIPKVSTSKKSMALTGEMIARRAFEIHASGKGGSELDNWFAAERQLRSEIV